jgi:peptidoglycan/LPS O-acetylase OafA/YrhL
MRNKRLLIILAAVGLLLLIPLVAMQFTNEVNWSGFDFLVMGFLLLGTGLICELVLRKVKKRTNRLVVCLAVLGIFILVWMELAIGIFGTPFAGA